MNKKQKTGLCIEVIFLILGFIASIISIMNDRNVYIEICHLILCCLIAYYIDTEYKRPHGNLLKYVLLAYAVSLIFGLNLSIKLNNVAGTIITPFIMLGIGYVSGRLHRFDQNKFIMIAISVLVIAICVTFLIVDGKWDIVMILAELTPAFIWISICVAYFTRYSEHKEAGLS